MEALVESIMNAKPEPVDPNLTVTKAAKAIAGRQEKCLVVAKDGLVVGVVTATDIIEKVIAAGANPSEVYLRDIMSTPVISVQSDSTILKAAGVMSDYGVGKLPVIDKSGGLVGIITALELSRWLARQSDYQDPALNAIAKMKKDGDGSPYR